MNELQKAYKKMKKDLTLGFLIWYGDVVIPVGILLYILRKSTMDLIVIAAITVVVIAALTISLSNKNIKKKFDELMKPEDVNLFYETIDKEMQNDICISSVDTEKNTWFLLTKTWLICLAVTDSIIRRRDTVYSCEAEELIEGQNKELVIKFTGEEDCFIFDCGALNEQIAQDVTKYLGQGETSFETIKGSDTKSQLPT